MKTQPVVNNCLIQLQNCSCFVKLLERGEGFVSLQHENRNPLASDLFPAQIQDYPIHGYYFALGSSVLCLYLRNVWPVAGFVFLKLFLICSCSSRLSLSTLCLPIASHSSSSSSTRTSCPTSVPKTGTFLFFYLQTDNKLIAA